MKHFLLPYFCDIIIIRVKKNMQNHAFMDRQVHSLTGDYDMAKKGVSGNTRKMNRKLMILIAVLLIAIVMIGIIQFSGRNSAPVVDAQGKPVVRTDVWYDENGNVTNYQEFDEKGNLIKRDDHYLTSEKVDAYTFRNTYKKDRLVKSVAYLNKEIAWTTDYTGFNDAGDATAWETHYNTSGITYHFTAEYKYYDDGSVKSIYRDRDGSLYSADDYDEDGNLIHFMSYSDGIWYDYSYDEEGRLKTTVQYDNNSVEQARVEFTRDGNKVTSTVYYPDGTSRVNSESETDDAGNTLKTTYYEVDGSVNTREYTYY